MISGRLTKNVGMSVTKWFPAMDYDLIDGVVRETFDKKKRNVFLVSEI